MPRLRSRTRSSGACFSSNTPLELQLRRRHFASAALRSDPLEVTPSSCSTPFLPSSPHVTCQGMNGIRQKACTRGMRF
ncbi:hypothetical protein CBOM_07917 [Ceraceosorus bombacis]|uniref:Uncharacterized protein n=1 Tax=Ceraceosorus bombacis TaxID=401625 RepID=A0A0P1BRF4_9BASI|nr:hypothetical protein CBOM_07917 [Ceraceosorus bombacis]